MGEPSRTLTHLVRARVSKKDLNKIRFSKFKKEIKPKFQTHNTKMLRSVENLPPRLNTTNQYYSVFKLTPGQNANTGSNLYNVKRKRRPQRLLLYKIINAVHFHSIT